MKIFLITLFALVSFKSSIAQENQSSGKGNYFTSKPGEYFKNVIEPWSYQYTPADKKETYKSIEKIGEIVFFRRQPIYDNVTKKYWKPDISYDVYSPADFKTLSLLSDSLKLNSSCDSINRGGDIQFVGNFILIGSSSCVNCSSASKIDYCRLLIKRFLEEAGAKDENNWNAIIRNLPISKRRFRP